MRIVSENINDPIYMKSVNNFDRGLLKLTNNVHNFNYENILQLKETETNIIITSFNIHYFDRGEFETRVRETWESCVGSSRRDFIFEYISDNSSIRQIANGC